MSKANKIKAEEKRKGGFARGVNTLLSGKFLTREYVQSNLPFIFFMVGMMVAYIAYGYFAENNLKSMVAAEAELHELKSRNLSVQAKLGKLRAQSTVEESIRDLGLHESVTPPTIIRVDPNENLSKRNEQ